MQACAGAPGGQWALFKRRSDPGQEHDLAEQNPGAGQP
jgi:hypothetical protein